MSGTISRALYQDLKTARNGKTSATRTTVTVVNAPASNEDKKWVFRLESYGKFVKNLIVNDEYKYAIRVAKKEAKKGTDSATVVVLSDEEAAVIIAERIAERELYY